MLQNTGKRMCYKYKYLWKIVFHVLLVIFSKKNHATSLIFLKRLKYSHNKIIILDH